MTTRPDERLPFLNLARRDARVVRSLPAGELERLAAIAPPVGALQVDLTFHLDQQGRARVTGTAESVARVTCQRCLEAFEQPLRVEVDVRVIRDPALASSLAEKADVLVVETESVTIADVVEDELILGLPERLCREEPCPHAPEMNFPASEAEPERRDNPFSVLSELKRSN
jgi:uncharacterized protein